MWVFKKLFYTWKDNISRLFEPFLPNQYITALQVCLEWKKVHPILIVHSSALLNETPLKLFFLYKVNPFKLLLEDAVKQKITIQFWEKSCY